MGSNYGTIKTINGLELRRHVDLSSYSSIGIGGKGELVTVVHNKTALQQLLSRLHGKQFQPFIIGGGTNVVFIAAQYSGLIIKLGQGFKHIKRTDKHEIKVGAATPLAHLLSYCQEHRLGGLEFCWGIPGTVGGAIAGNAGSYTKGICQVLDFVSGFNYDGIYLTLHPGEFDYGYRYCGLKNFIVTEAGFRLGSKSSNSDKELDKMKELKAKQPVNEKSSGCVFKNPHRYAAGWLIEAAGLKGISIGDAEVSTVHSNFIINRGRASLNDFICLIKLIKNKVREKFNVELELEVRLIGVSG